MVIKPMLRVDDTCDAYNIVSDFVTSLSDKIIQDYGACINDDYWLISIKTGTLDDDLILYDSYHQCFMDDWYEGGFLEIYFAVPLDWILDDLLYSKDWNEVVYNLLKKRHDELLKMNKHFDTSEYLQVIGQKGE